MLLIMVEKIIVSGIVMIRGSERFIINVLKIMLVNVIIELIDRLNLLLIISIVVVIVRIFSCVVGVRKFRMFESVNIDEFVVNKKKIVIRINFVIELSFGFLSSFVMKFFLWICLFIVIVVFVDMLIF